MSKADNLDEIRRHFRRETGKLDNWIRHRRIYEYFVREEHTSNPKEENSDAPEA